MAEDTKIVDGKVVKQSEVKEALLDGLGTGSAAAIATSYINTGSQLGTGKKIAKVVLDAAKSAEKPLSASAAEALSRAERGIIDFNSKSHSGWVAGVAAAGLAAGTVYGAMKAQQHNRDIDSHAEKLDAERKAFEAGVNKTK